MNPFCTLSFSSIHFLTPAHVVLANPTTTPDEIHKTTIKSKTKKGLDMKSSLERPNTHVCDRGRNAGYGTDGIDLPASNER